MTMELIIAQLDRIHEDDGWYTVRGTEIDLTINDFEGFAADWSEIDHEWVDKAAVDEVLAWLADHADFVDGDFYRHHHFGEIVVELGYTSYDI